MQLIDIQQGSPEWLALRLGHFTASEAPAMMGDSPYTKRVELLYQKATGYRPVVTPYQQKKFDEGHAAEALARPLVERREGQELFPVTAVRTINDLPLLASFDGLDLDKTLVFEHKLWNKKLVAQIEGEGLEPLYYWQLEHQLLVAEQAERALLVCSDGTAENFRYVYYESQDYRRDALIAGWKQFQKDLEQYKADLESGDIKSPYQKVVIRNDATFRDAELEYLQAMSQKKIADTQLDQAREKLINLTGGLKTKGDNLHLYPTHKDGAVRWKAAFKAMVPEVSAKDLEPFKGESSISWTVKAL
ncbi:YqaJ viral recombinase family protein [Endozoicomonas sp. SCSIO W0465]|uniref:YqaJ viral recombinase family protein n=1 Tax=Endozoicomonas sp. SCSIO W0465 TaxID=2918516 RepID=UPI002075B3DA|nr:YqaJ viral recombinase family protein [Endozoicomonas sp. SCSIO W0465]USE36413.1 YqaJ viral recombinase family protein [Endozoicomonas sp. SCSIO W0465]